MKTIRKVAGVLSLVGFVVFMNTLVLTKDPFVAVAAYPFLAGVAFGMVWIVAAILSLADAETNGRGLRGLNSAVSSIVFLLICVTIYAFADHWGVSWDLTREGRRQLAEQTVQVLQGLDRDIEIYALFPQTDDTTVTVAREKTRRFLEQCQEYTSRLKVEFVDPQADPVLVEKLEVTRQSGLATVVVRSGIRTKQIAVPASTARLEERDFTSALVNVIRDAKPKICFLTGHGELDLQSADPRLGINAFGQWLVNEAYEVSTIAMPLARPEVPADCTLLVLVRPSDLLTRELEALDRFMDRGGRLLIFLEPPLDMAEGKNADAVQLVGWLAGRFGVAVGQDIVLPRVARRAGEVLLVPDLSRIVGDQGLFDDSGDFASCFDQSSPITRGFDQNMALIVARTVSLGESLPEGVAGTTLLRSLPDTWAETDFRMLASDRKSGAGPDPDERKGPLSVAVAVTKKTEMAVGDSGQTRDARVVVVGDADIATNEQIQTPGHYNFLLNAVAWLTESEELIADIRPTGDQDPPIMLAEGEEQLIAWTSILGTVQFVVAVGLVVFAWRRRYP